MPFLPASLSKTYGRKYLEMHKPKLSGSVRRAFNSFCIQTSNGYFRLGQKENIRTFIRNGIINTITSIYQIDYEKVQQLKVGKKNQYKI